MLIRGLLLLVGLSLAGCFGVGMGRAVPGAREIYRQGGRWVDAGGGYERFQAGDPHGAGGPIGGLIGGRFGMGNVKIGDGPALDGAGQLDLRLELAFSPHERFGVAASVGWSIAGAHDADTDVSRTGFPMGLVVNLVPLRPFVVRAGGFVRPGYITIDEVGGKKLGFGAEAGCGVLMQFIAWHFVAMVDWQREWISDVDTPGGPRTYVSDFVLLDIYVIGW
jgi:hypothetical protein